MTVEDLVRHFIEASISGASKTQVIRKFKETKKIFEGFIKDWIMKDIFKNLDISQFGGQKGIGTEHMIVMMIDRILWLLDRFPQMSAVISANLDWSAAFDRQDPTLSIQKFIKLGVRPSLIPILISYLSDRRMKVKFNGEESETLKLIGGGPQGTLLGQIQYLVLTNDNSDNISINNRFKYIDDLTILELVQMAGILIEYNFLDQISSDIGLDQKYLPRSIFITK